MFNGMRGSRRTSSQTPFRAIARRAGGGRGAKLRPTESQLAAASRAYRHLRWQEPDAIAEALTAIAAVQRDDAPALYRSLATAIVGEAASRLAILPAVADRAHAAKRIEALLDDNGEGESEVDRLVNIAESVLRHSGE